MSSAVHATLRTQRKNNSFHGNLSISVPIPATASNPDSDGNIVSLSQTLHCSPSAIPFSKLHSNLNRTDNSVSPDLKKSSDNVRTDIDELVYSNTSSASSANSYGNENNDGHHGKNINRGEDVVCDDGVNYMISTEIAPSNIHENTQDKKDIIFEISSSPSEKAVDSNNRNQPINLCDDEEVNEEFENCAIIEKISRLQDEKDDITALHDSTTFQLRNQSNDSNDGGNAMVTSDPVHTSDIQIRKEDQFRTKDVSPRNINEWILRRRWTSNVFKMLLPALIE